MSIVTSGLKHSLNLRNF